MTKPRLDLTLADSVGYVPDQSKVNTLWRHFKNSKSRYYITGFIWDAKIDRWNYAYCEQNGFITCGRTPEDFHGLVPAKSDKVPDGFIDQYVHRFTEVELPITTVTRLMEI